MLCASLVFGAAGCSASSSGEPPGPAGGGGGSGDPDPDPDSGTGDGPGTRPSFLFLLTDDQRDDTLACMPKLQARIARGSLRFANSYATTPLCCPSRSTILTGQYAGRHGVRNNGGELDDEQFGGAALFKALGNEELAFVKSLHQAGYRTGYFGKYLNGTPELLEEDGASYVPPYWDEWRGTFQTENIFYYFTLVEKALGEARARRVCYLPTPAFDERERDVCRGDAEEVVNDGAENYLEDVVSAKAAAFMSQAVADGVPFFAYVGFKAPHAPFISSRRYQPDPEVYAYSDEALAILRQCPYWDWADRPATYLQADEVNAQKQPLWARARKQKYDLGELPELSGPDLQRKRRAQLASLLAVDDEVEELFVLLEESGRLEDTVVIFTGDNGYSWGEHYWDSKNCSFEHCGRVPLVVFHPDQTQPATSDWLAGNIDHAPTIYELSGTSPPASATLDGLSYAALLRGGEAPPRDALLVECYSGSFQRAKGGPDFHTGVRTARWKYIEHYQDQAMTQLRMRPDGSPDVDLYDLAEDPIEERNLANFSNDRLTALGYGPADLQAQRAELAETLERLRRW